MSEEAIGYVIDADHLEKLKKIQGELMGGTDRERDFGHLIWLITKEAVGVSAPELK